MTLKIDADGDPDLVVLGGIYTGFFTPPRPARPAR